MNDLVEDLKIANDNLYCANKMLEKEIERLNKQIEEYQKALDETVSEKIDLENIIKEVRELLKNDYFENGSFTNYYKVFELLDKLQELKGESNEK